MQIGRAVRVDKLQKVRISANQLVSLYDDAPQEELTLDEFELFALDRLQLLRGIEILQARGHDGKEFSDKLGVLETKHMPLRTRGDNVVADRSGRTADQRKDQVSHFILRLAYCRTEELRNWFCKYECVLLKHRLDKMSEVERSQVHIA
jgi:DNA primase large subunit